MADNYNQMIIAQSIPRDLINVEDEEFLQLFGIEIYKNPNGYYLYAEDYSSFAEDETGKEFDEEDLINFLQRLIIKSDGELRYIAMEGALTCSKMRPGKFGGYAIFVTEDNVEYVSTGQWISDRIYKLDHN